MGRRGTERGEYGGGNGGMRQAAYYCKAKRGGVGMWVGEFRWRCSAVEEKKGRERKKETKNPKVVVIGVKCEFFTFL